MEYVYGALLLHKLGKEITETSLKKVVEATGTEVDESKIKTLIASLKGIDINKELETASVVSVASGEEAKPEEAEEEDKPKPEEAAAGLSSLFG